LEDIWEDIDDILQEVDVNATQVAGSAAERGSRSVSRNRGLTQVQDERTATGSATVGPVTQIAPSSTQMAQDSTVTRVESAAGRKVRKTNNHASRGRLRVQQLPKLYERGPLRSWLLIFVLQAA